MKNEYTITVNGLEITYYRIDNDINGNPRYVTHFLNLGVMPADYGHIKGLTKYRGKWFGGGYVFQSYNVHDSLVHMLSLVDTYYLERNVG